MIVFILCIKQIADFKSKIARKKKKNHPDITKTDKKDKTLDKLHEVINNVMEFWIHFIIICTDTHVNTICWDIFTNYHNMRVSTSFHLGDGKHHIIRTIAIGVAKCVTYSIQHELFRIDIIRKFGILYWYCVQKTDLFIAKTTQKRYQNYVPSKSSSSSTCPTREY